MIAIIRREDPVPSALLGDLEEAQAHVEAGGLARRERTIASIMIEGAAVGAVMTLRLRAASAARPRSPCV